MIHEQARRARLAQKLTQEKLCEGSGLARSQVLRFEAGENVTLDTLFRYVSQLPELKTLTAGPVELELRHLDAAAVRSALLGFREATDRLLNALDGTTPEPPPAGASFFDAGSHVSPELAHKLDAAVERIERGEAGEDLEYPGAS